MKFIVMYMAPAANLAEWMKMPEEQRKADEDKMKADWDAFMEKHGSMFLANTSVGATTRVTKDGVSNTHNDLMLYSIVEAESAEALGEIFKDHPHFGIPGATIEIMPTRPIEDQ